MSLLKYLFIVLNIILITRLHISCKRLSVLWSFQTQMALFLVSLAMLCWISCQSPLSISEFSLGALDASVFIFFFIFFFPKAKHLNDKDLENLGYYKNYFYYYPYWILLQWQYGHSSSCNRLFWFVTKTKHNQWVQRSCNSSCSTDTKY